MSSAYSIGFNRLSDDYEFVSLSVLLLLLLIESLCDSVYVYYKLLVSSMGAPVNLLSDDWIFIGLLIVVAWSYLDDVSFCSEAL